MKPFLWGVIEGLFWGIAFVVMFIAICLAIGYLWAM